MSPQARATRTLGLAAIGMCWVGPLLTVWFSRLDRAFPGSSFKPVAIRTALDQIFEAPFMISCIFGFATLAEEGVSREGIEKANTKIHDKLIPTWQSGLTVWVPMQFLNQVMRRTLASEVALLK